MVRRKTPLVRYCEFCGHPFGKERGPASKTCSEECQRDRNNAKEKARYQKVKGTDHWKQVRSDYLNQLVERAQVDPAFAEKLAARHRATVRKFYAAVKANPERLDAYREARRKWHRERGPEEKADRKYWYGTLSPEKKLLFLLGLREQRAQERLSALLEN